MPLVRGRLLPEVESTGRMKRALDVLLYLERMDKPTAIGIDIIPIPKSLRTEQLPKEVGCGLTDSLKVVLATALDNDADCVVVNDPAMLAYVDDFGKAGVLLTSPDFLHRYAETFVRGHDIPWAFAHKVWFE